MAAFVYRVALFMCVMISPLSIGAAILGSLNVDGTGFGTEGVQPSELSLGFALSGDTPGLSCWAPSTSCIVLLDRVVTPADIGAVFSFGPSTPGFGSVVSFLTDGVDDEWSFFIPGNGGGVGASVSSILPPRSGPDFAGDTITEIDLTLTALTFTQMGLPTSLGFETFTFANPNYTIAVEGETPEPEPALLVFGALLIGLASRRHWKRFVAN
jgi:hypothetical protein